MTNDVSAAPAMAADYTTAGSFKDPHAVAAHVAEDAAIVLNRGDPSNGRTEIAQMAAGFHANVPDVTLTCAALEITPTMSARSRVTTSEPRFR